MIAKILNYINFNMLYKLNKPRRQNRDAALRPGGRKMAKAPSRCAYIVSYLALPFQGMRCSPLVRQLLPHIKVDVASTTSEEAR